MHVVDTLGFASTNMGTDVITSSRRRHQLFHRSHLSLFSLFSAFQSPLFLVNSDHFNQRFKLYLVKHLMDNKERRGPNKTQFLDSRALCTVTRCPYVKLRYRQPAEGDGHFLYVVTRRSLRQER
jgi:hypothetical protein